MTNLPLKSDGNSSNFLFWKINFREVILNTYIGFQMYQNSLFFVEHGT